MPGKQTAVSQKEGLMSMETGRFPAVYIRVTITVKIMTGDFILWIRNVLRQNLSCVHHYVRKGSVMFSESGYEQCGKCGKLKK